jgi:hypothetical protein
VVTRVGWGSRSLTVERKRQEASPAGCGDPLPHPAFGLPSPFGEGGYCAAGAASASLLVCVTRPGSGPV